MIISHKLVYFCVLIPLLFNVIISKRSKLLKSSNSEMKNYLPSYENLDFYVGSLERVIDFSHKYRNDLDLNFMFGLFLVNANLIEFTKDVNLPERIRKTILNLLTTNSKSLFFFTEKRNNGQETEVNLKISTFFKNSTHWSKRMNKLVLSLHQGKGFEIDRFERAYPNWRTYVRYVNDIDKWEPSPEQSDQCLAALSENEENYSSHTPICRFPENCYKMLRDGTNFGYGVTHRLLFLLLAHFGRGCAIFSAAQDTVISRNLCEIILSEADYLANNGFKHADLMFEQIALCTLSGHAEFLRRSWLSNLLRYQTEPGCFGQHRGDEEVMWKHDLLNGTCNAHVTAAAAGSLAAAVRLLLENYY